MRALWFVAGTAAGVYATAKARRAAEALTVDGIHDRLTGWFAGARVLGEELRTGAAEKESLLRTRLEAERGPRSLPGRPKSNPGTWPGSSTGSTGSTTGSSTESLERTGASRVPVEGKGDH